MKAFFASVRKLRMGLTILLTIAVLTAGTVGIWAVPTVEPSRKVHDLAGLLSETEIAELEQQALAVMDSYGMDVAVALVSGLEGSGSIRDYADDFFDYNGFGVGSGYDGILFVYDTAGSEIYISTHGEGIYSFTDEYINHMLDAIAPRLRGQDYSGAVSVYVELARTRLENVRINPAIRGTPEDEANLQPGWADSQGGAAEASGYGSRRNLAELAGKSLIFAVLVTGCVALVLAVIQNSSMPGSPDVSRLYLQGGVNVTGRQDVFLRTNTVRTALPKDDDNNRSSGGGGGGRSTTHTSSSGSTHGGGGRKI